METYNIIRFKENGSQKVQQRGVSLKQAQEWCQRDDTSSRTHPKGKNGCKYEWFDGYIKN